MTGMPPRPAPSPRLYLIPIITVLLALVCMSLVSDLLGRRYQQRLHDHFMAEINHVTEEVRGYMTAYGLILRGGSGLFSASDQVTRDDWRQYVEQLGLDEVYRGIQGVGFAQYVATDQLDDYQQQIRRQGFPDFQVTPPGERQSYTSIIYLEPFSGRNLRAFGYDMFSEPVRRAAMERARDTGLVSLSGKVLLLQESDTNIQAGTLAYYPVYAKGALPQTVAQRRATLVGWTYSPYRMNDLVDGMVREDLNGLRLEIFDESERLDAQSLLYDSHPSGGGHAEHEAQDGQPLFVNVVPMDVGGRTWTLRFSSLPSFAANAAISPPWAERGAMLLICLLLLGITWALVNTQRRAERIARQMTVSLRESQEHFRTIFEQAAVGIVQIDPRSRRLLRANQRFCRLLGYSRDELEQLTSHDLSHPDDLAQIDQQFRELDERAVSQFSLEKRYLHKDSHILWVNITASAVYTADGEIHYYLTMVEDITARKQDETRLRLAASVFTHAREGIVITDRSNTIVEVNTHFSRITGYERQEMLGQPLSAFKSARHPSAFYQAIEQTLKNQGYWSGEIWSRRKSGDLYLAAVTVSLVHDAQGRLQNRVTLFSDITLMKAQQDQLEHLAYHDALTHLPNRMLFADRLQQGLALSNRTGKSLAVIYLDLDGFKAINDNHGHDIGDELLVIVGQRLKAALREIDTLARIGGDEFAAVLVGLERPEDCKVTLERLLETAAEPVLVGELSLSVTASIGASLYPQAGTSAEQLLYQADQAMYQAKKEGKNRYCLSQQLALATEDSGIPL